MHGGVPYDDEHAALLALLDVRPGIGEERHGKTAWSTIASEVVQRGSAIALWEELRPPSLEGIDWPDGAVERARAMLAEWRRSDFELVSVLDSRYPLALRAIHQLPPVLFVKGQLITEDVGVSVVGSRNASERGISIASILTRGLVERGICVISGLAAGIDAAAHRAPIAAGGRPMGVLGTGINQTYPADNRDLHDMVAAAGVLVSQFMPDTAPGKTTFPMRNATMSGLGRASIVVEAGEHSGSRIQARLAVEHGRPVILTDNVVGATQWAKRLQHRPGVYVAGSTADVLGLVDALVAEPDHGRALAVLGSRSAT